MINPSMLMAYLLVSVSFALIPGPGVMCILTNSVSRGASAGVKVCIGVAVATLFHISAATLGLTAVLAAVPAAFIIVKIAGAAYLCWLGWQMLRNPIPMDTEPAQSYLRSPFAQGALANILNPKMAIFFLAIFPQFLDPVRGDTTTQAIQLGACSVSSTALINLAFALLGGKARRLVLNRPIIFSHFQRAAGILLIGLGIRVALRQTR